MKAPMLTADTVRKGLCMLTATMLTLLIISGVFSVWDLDRTVSARFFSPETGWYLKDAQPWHWLYRHGTIPGLLLSIVALAGAVITRLRCPDSGWHRYLLLVVLTTVLGAGLLVNGILKPYWGRPRPNQLQQFGGQYRYRNVFSPGIPGKGRSFPSGHPTMAFIFTTLIYFYRKSKAVAWIGGGLGVAYGGIMSAARVVQGAHFVTDCLWSFGSIWITASVLYYFVLNIPSGELRAQRRPVRGAGLVAVVIGALVSAVVLVMFVVRQPYFESYYFYMGPIDPKIRTLQIGLKNGFARTHIRYAGKHPPLVLIHARGFAWPGASEIQGNVSVKISNDIYRADYILQKKGFFTELTHDIEVVLPDKFKERLSVVFVK